MIRVAIFPPWNPWLGNRMFEGAEGCVYTSAFHLWRERARESGFEIATQDLVPKGSADILWFLDLPRTKNAWREALSTGRSDSISALQILESPLLFPAAFQKQNRALFDAVVSFELESDHSPKQFHYRLPVDPKPCYEGLAFEDRRLAVMVNTNRHEGWLATRKNGLTGLPGIGPCFSGWNLPSGFLLHPAKGELYSWRRAVAKHFALTTPTDLDLFGGGWNGETVSWAPWCKFTSPCRHNEVLNESPKQRTDAKRERLGRYRFVIAAENYRGQRGYISEKIFDAMLGGAVPVYLGEERICESVPAGCFVDSRDYKDIPTLVNALRSMGQEEWEARREVAREFLKSDAFRPFTEDVYVERMMEILREFTHSVATPQLH